MHFPKFWAKATQSTREASGQNVLASCWRWSDLSFADAQASARQAVQQLAERFAREGRPMSRYGYGDRPLRELVVREIRDAKGDLAAAISRNGYGCLVLNSARVMFVDVDVPELEGSGIGLLRKLMGKPSPEVLVQQAVERAEEWVRRNTNWGWRIYRTRAGLRLLATHGVFEPESAATQTAFEAMRADPLYRKLCQTQKCFRARLTPKPWRCGLTQAPGGWPFVDATAEGRFNSWVTRYQAAAQEKATCELISSVGNSMLHPEVQTLVQLHDELARVGSRLPLA